MGRFAFAFFGLFITSCGTQVLTAKVETPGCRLTNGCVRLAWDPVTTDTGGNAITVDGYRLHWGASSGLYTETKDVGNTTTAQLTELEHGRHFFVVTAYLKSSDDEILLESDYSNEATTILREPTSNYGRGGPLTPHLRATPEIFVDIPFFRRR